MIKKSLGVLLVLVLSFIAINSLTTVSADEGDTTPRIAYWWGKVNQHIDANGMWQSDTDGTSGADLDKLTYCKKFYPNTVSVTPYKSETITTWRRAMYFEQSPYTATVMTDKCDSTIVPPPPSNLSVDLKINGSDNPSPIPFKSKMTATWTSTGVANCMAAGHWVPLWPGTSGLWNNSVNSISGSLDLMAAWAYNGNLNQIQFMSPLEISIQCWNNGVQVTDKVIVNLTQENGPIDPSRTIRITSPNGGETFTQGQSNTITWVNGNGITKIGLVDADATTTNSPNVIGWIRTDVSTGTTNISWDGRTTTDLAGTVTWPVIPGRYKIIAVGATLDGLGNYCMGSSSPYISCNFDISDSSFRIGLQPEPQAPYYIDSISGQKSQYTPGASIDLIIGGKERSNGSITTGIDQEGFHIQSYIFKDLGNNEASQAPAYLPPNPETSYNGSFNTGSGAWNFHMIAPMAPGKYIQKVSLYCAQANRYCGQTYGASQHQYDMILHFTVSLTASSNSDIVTGATLPAGCTSSKGYSPITGVSCGISTTGPVTTPSFSANFKRTLSIGSKGDDVKALQKILNIKADGIYGKGTAARLKQWQSSYGLVPNGVFGPSSIGKINSN